jgi:hypothetical protein
LADGLFERQAFGGQERLETGGWLRDDGDEGNGRERQRYLARCRWLCRIGYGDALS